MNKVALIFIIYDQPICSIGPLGYKLNSLALGSILQVIERMFLTDSRIILIQGFLTGVNLLPEVNFTY